MKLPIDIKPNTDPTIFVWTQIINTLNGPTEVIYTGVLPTTCEDAVRELIAMVKRQAKEIEELKKGALYRPGYEGPVLTKDVQTTTPVITTPKPTKGKR